ncbi:MAG TPA: hypothetical protein VFV73_12485 [Streptosporangiaceae bacterium]|nr:hypothetical protein [Streptosporangiaceae bacterium]
MDLFTSVLVKAISGIMYIVYWLAFRLLRIAWWLTLYLILSLASGVAWLARGGHGKPVDSGGFGHVLEDGSGWQADDSGTVYPASADNPESCTIEAELGGQYWRRTMLNRLLRRGALWKYTFYARLDSAPGNGRETAAAWLDFPQEAWKNVTLDDIDPQSPHVLEMPADALRYNREEAQEALKHINWLLEKRGWTPDDTRPAEGTDRHWYSSRYRRPVIAWEAPVAPAIPPPLSAEQSAGQQ